MTEPYEEIGPN